MWMNLRGTLILAGMPVKSANVSDGTTTELSAPFMLSRTTKLEK